MPPVYAEQDQRHQRTSLYLVKRADALLGALRFFCAPSSDTCGRLQFLAQSDFWDWEIENLIYSFTNLAERRETWKSPKATLEKLGDLGIAVKANMVDRVTYGRHWRMHHTGERVAPVALLKEVIEEWNRLIGVVEKQFIVPMRKDAERWNIQTRKDLNSLRKVMPKLEEMEED